MTKNIVDYLPMYLGCEVLYKGEIHFLSGVSRPYKTNDKTIPTFSVRPDKNGFRSTIYSLENFDDIRLILRRLYDMTEVELQECGNMIYDFSDDPELNDHKWEEFQIGLAPEQFHWLIKKGFWLFGDDWFDEGLIIDKATLK